MRIETGILNVLSKKEYTEIYEQGEKSEKKVKKSKKGID